MRSAALIPPEQRSGWAIDNVRITASKVPAGAIRVTSNLSQARYSIRRGGLTRDGQGLSQTFTNLPPGDYVVTFDTLPFLLTPAPRTSSVTALVTNVISANYGMEDGKIFDFISRTTPTSGQELSYLTPLFKLLSFN